MRKKIYNLMILIILLTILFLILSFPKEIVESVKESIILWKDNVFPTLFPFFLISDLLINYGFIELIGELTKRITNRLFNLPGEASFAIVLSMISGSPSNAKYIKKLLDEKKITEKQAEYLLCFTHFSNPLFILGTVSILLNDIKIGTIILISHFIGNYILGIFLKTKEKINIEKINLRKAINNMYNKKKNTSFSISLSESIFKNINTLILILGIIITFTVLSTIINNLLNTNKLNISLISGILEMTQGIKKISLLNIPINIKASIITIFLSFGGISIHMQVFSILSDTKIKYKYYLISRIIHSLISSILVYIIIYYSY